MITRPAFFCDEAQQAARLLMRGDAGLLHIRKPQSCEEEVEALVIQLADEWRDRLVLHDYFHLAVRYGLHGVHLNSRNPLPPAGWHGSVSRSCHTLEEVRRYKTACTYVSLSPIFDSVSKQGYHSAFSREQIAAAVHDGTIDNKVYALGGVRFSMLEEVRAMGFGGAMILGDAWR
ncbi:MAG: thiamine phosphate synthase [Prevotellaceae bacterium]|nr:thiamine phosphate synthase [Prevotellaceae bacterium]MDO4932746.1 thiamine phosphate synthase [Prevotellaceae bacterium]